MSDHTPHLFHWYDSAEDQPDEGRLRLLWDLEATPNPEQYAPSEYHDALEHWKSEILNLEDDYREPGTIGIDWYIAIQVDAEWLPYEVAVKHDEFQANPLKDWLKTKTMPRTPDGDVLNPYRLRRSPASGSALLSRFIDWSPSVFQRYVDTHTLLALQNIREARNGR